MMAGLLGNFCFVIFRTSTFAQIYSKKLNVDKTKLNKFLWGDYYYNAKLKKIQTPKQLRNTKSGLNIEQSPMFVEFILKNIWEIYDSVLLNNNQEKIKKIVNVLGIKVLDRDIRSKNTKQLLQNMLRQWLPISNCVLCSVVELVPSPLQSQKRLESFFIKNDNNISLIKENVMKCSKEGEAVAYLSKTFYVEKEFLKNPSVPKKEEEIKNLKGEICDDLLVSDISQYVQNKDMELVGLGRLYSGTLKVGQKIFFLGPKFKKGSNDHVFEIVIEGLFLIMGNDFYPLKEVPSGNIFGISGVSNSISKYATLTSTLNCPNLCVNNKTIPPILKVAIEPKNPSELFQLENGLKQLSISDPVAEVSTNKNGEFVLSTAGELHLERCLTDLKERFVNIEIQISDPIVPFKETIVFPKTDNLKEKIPPNLGNAEIEILDGLIRLKLKIFPMPSKVLEFLQNHINVIKKTFKSLHSDFNESVNIDEFNLETDTEIQISKIKEMDYTKLLNTLKSLYSSKEINWIEMMDKIWSFGPHRVGPNILINNLKFSKRRFCDDQNSSERYIVIRDSCVSLKQIEDSINNAFQIFTANGPLCMEPIIGILCSVEDIIIDNNSVIPVPLENTNQNFDYKKNSLIVGSLISEFREAAKNAFCQWPQRILLAYFECNILTTLDVIGRVYGVINQRKGEIISEEVKEGSSIYSIQAHLPIIESFRFGDEVYKRTSGLAFPHLYFKGFKILDIDPNWVPTTKEEIEEFGDNLEKANLAKKYINMVRKKKGLLVEEKVFIAEKQRTLKK